MALCPVFCKACPEFGYVSQYLIDKIICENLIPTQLVVVYIEKLFNQVPYLTII
jgi:hypothetical protein